MTVPKDAFRQFQEELTALDRKIQQRNEQSPQAYRLSQAKQEFLLLQRRYQLTIADVVAFFPEAEGIAYLQQLIAAAEANPAKRGRPRKNKPTTEA